MTVAACPRCGCGCHDVPAMPPLPGPRDTLLGLGDAPPSRRDTLPCPPPSYEPADGDVDVEPDWSTEAITEVQCPHPPGGGR